MKQAILTTIICCFTAFALVAQGLTISSIYIERSMSVDSKDKIQIGLYLDIDVNSIDLTNPIISKETILNVCKDNNDYNILDAHNLNSENLKKEGFYFNNDIISYKGIGNYATNKDLLFQIELNTKPSKGSTHITIGGTIALNILSDDEKELSLKDIPISTKSNDGIQSEIGNISLRKSFTTTVGETEYHVYDLITEVSILGIEQEGDRSKIELQDSGMGLERNQLVFKNIPESVDVNLIYSIPVKKEIQFNLTTPIGI